MKYQKRKFTPHECLHVYQKTVDGFNIFYDRGDALVFYSIFSVLAKIYKVKALALCLMIDHIHALLSAEELTDISDFVRHYSSLFVTEYNQHIGRHGCLFHKSFGSAPKVGGKKVRSTIVYIGNNPVEKKICSKAEEYRWNFLAYMYDANPFSERMSPSRFSMKLRRAVNEVKGTYSRNAYLTYSQILRIFDGLVAKEREYLTDFIIGLYFPFDEDMLMSYCGTYQDMIHAMHSTVGGEYDIREDFNAGTDRVYAEMQKYLSDELQISPMRMVTVMPDEQKLEIAALLKRRIAATSRELSKFVHLKIGGR